MQPLALVGQNESPVTTACMIGLALGSNLNGLVADLGPACLEHARAVARFVTRRRYSVAIEGSGRSPMVSVWTASPGTNVRSAPQRQLFKHASGACPRKITKCISVPTEEAVRPCARLKDAYFWRDGNVYGLRPCTCA
eukprot:gene14935-biopygen6626